MLNALSRPVQPHVVGKVEAGQKSQEPTVSTTHIENRRLVCRVGQISEDDRMVGDMGDCVEPFRVIAFGVLRVPPVHAYAVASRESIEVPQHFMYRTASFESG